MTSRTYYIYILSNYLRTVLYIGVSNDLKRQVWEHKQHFVDGFTKKYAVHDLMYYEEFETAYGAIAREKQLKKFSRNTKDKIIRAFNP